MIEIGKEGYYLGVPINIMREGLIELLLQGDADALKEFNTLLNATSRKTNGDSTE